MKLEIVPFEEKYLDDAAALLAARHARDRTREAALPEAFESSAATRPLIESVLRQPAGQGVFARREGKAAGFLIAMAMLPAPAHFLAQFFAPRSMVMPYHGHAVADDASVYRDMYGALAGSWVARGFFDHFVNVSPGDAGVRDAWDSLAFGRDSTCAARDVSAPVEGRRAAGIEIHQAGPEDISVVDEMTTALMAHHAGSPIFSPHLVEPRASSREMTLQLLADAANAHFVAYRDGGALGMQTFMPPSFLSPMETPEQSVYLLQGVVYEEARGDGIGSALLEHSMRWCGEQGYRWCTLHFAAPNTSGAPFWLGNGFRPIEHRLRRHIDERIAWAGA